MGRGPPIQGASDSQSSVSVLLFLRVGATTKYSSSSVAKPMLTWSCRPNLISNSTSYDRRPTLMIYIGLTPMGGSSRLRQLRNMQRHSECSTLVYRGRIYTDQRVEAAISNQSLWNVQGSERVVFDIRQSLPFVNSTVQSCRTRTSLTSPRWPGFGHCGRVCSSCAFYERRSTLIMQAIPTLMCYSLVPSDCR
jgi:hypothetical protein